MEYYKKYRLIQNISLAESVNHIIRFFHRLPLVGKATGDKYKFYGLKRFIYFLGPLFSLIGQFVRSCISLAASLWISGLLIWLTNLPWQLNKDQIDGIFGIGLNSLAFLSTYITAALLSSALLESKDQIRKNNLQLRMNPKASGLSLAVFNPLRVAIARAFTFCFLFKAPDAFLLSFILLNIRLISNSTSLLIYKKIGENIADKLSVIILTFVASFFIFKYLTLPPTLVLTIIFAITLVGAIFSVKYLFAYQGYGEILELAKSESINISTDFNQISNESLKLKDEDIATNSKATGTGYKFLNNLFFERHKRLIIKPALKRAVIMFGLVITALLFIKFKYQIFAADINKYILIVIAEVLFIVFNNEPTSRAMFLNCDRPLINYGFYKNKAAIFDMFKYRYVALLKLELLGLGLMLIAFGLAYGLFSAITLDNLLIYVFFALAAYIFYPAYNLGNYYLLQPYNYEASLTGFGYKWVVAVLNYVNILFLPLMVIKGLDGFMIIKILGITMLIASLVYILLVRLFGHRRFKIKQ